MQCARGRWFEGVKHSQRPAKHRREYASRQTGAVERHGTGPGWRTLLGKLRMRLVLPSFARDLTLHCSCEIRGAEHADTKCDVKS